MAKAKKKGKKKDRHRPGYYHDYNIAHPERLERIGIYRDDVSGKLGHFDDDGNFGYICCCCGAHFSCPDFVDDDW